jgi:hypothetical protein
MLIPSMHGASAMARGGTRYAAWTILALEDERARLCAMATLHANRARIGRINVELARPLGRALLYWVALAEAETARALRAPLAFA